MKHIITVLSIVFISSAAFAQRPGMPPGPPGSHPAHPMMPSAPALKASYPDSTAFNAAFKELLPLIRPTPNVKERAQDMLDRMSRMFKARGVDSVKAYDSVMKGIDPSMDEKILFTAYRAQFSAEEIKEMIPFFKSAVGKHYLEVENHLFGARNGEIDSYVRTTVNKIVMPMGKKPDTPPSMKPSDPNLTRPGTPGPPRIRMDSTTSNPPVKN